MLYTLDKIIKFVKYSSANELHFTGMNRSLIHKYVTKGPAEWAYVSEMAWLQMGDKSLH